MNTQKKESQPTAVVLGGTIPHIELLNKLRKKGYYTVLIDYYQEPPAKPFADEHVCESTLDQEAVCRIAKGKQAAIILAPCVDQANVVACRVSQKLGLPVPYDSETAMNVTDKGRMKKIMISSGVPTSPFAVVSDPAQADALDMQYPAVVKPVDNNGSKGVRRVDSDDERAAALRDALSLSRAGRAVIEGFNEGFEIQVDCVVKDHVTHVIMTRRRLKTKPVKGNAIQSFGSVIPAALSETLNEKIGEIASSIAQGFKLNNTPFFMQAIVNGEDISVLEFAPRIGGTLSYFLMKEITGFDALDAAVAGIEGEPFSVAYHDATHYYTTNIVYARHGILGEITGLEEMKEKGEIRAFFYMKSRGSTLGTAMDSRNRVACYVIRGESRAELLARAAQVQDHIDVFDEKGSSIMCRELVLTDSMIPGGIV